MLVTDWKNCWKWLSVHVAVLIVLLNTAQVMLPEFRAFLSPLTFTSINAALGVFVVLARLYAQGDLDA